MPGVAPSGARLATAARATGCAECRGTIGVGDRLIRARHQHFHADPCWWEFVNRERELQTRAVALQRSNK